MADDMKRKSPAQADFVDIEDRGAVRYWTHALGITALELENAVQLVGPDVGRVYDFVRTKQLRPGQAGGPDDYPRHPAS